MRYFTRAGTIENSGRITLAGDTMTKYIACRSLDSSRRRSRISSIREEYCIYIDDDEYGYYLPNGSKTSMPFGMLVQQILGEQGQIKVRIAKQLLDDVPAIRYTIATFDPETSNPDTLYQGGSSAADVFPGTNEVFEGEINGYGEISSGGIGISKNYTIYYVYDGINPIIEYTPNGNMKKKYVYAGGRHIAKIAGADTHYYHCDALGSPTRVTNENGSSKWMTRYYPFGEMFTQTGSGNTHTFTGKEWDSEMNLNYFCQRYYDPEIGRFMTLDPLMGRPELPQSQNRYAYCMNNPLKYIDPLGLVGDLGDWWNEDPSYLMDLGIDIVVTPYKGYWWRNLLGPMYDGDRPLIPLDGFVKNGKYYPRRRVARPNRGSSSGRSTPAIDISFKERFNAHLDAVKAMVIAPVVFVDPAGFTTWGPEALGVKTNIDALVGVQMAGATDIGLLMTGTIVVGGFLAGGPLGLAYSAPAWIPLLGCTGFLYYNTYQWFLNHPFPD